MIFGSGTSTTRTSCLPYQQFAFIAFLLFSKRGTDFSLSRLTDKLKFAPRRPSHGLVVPPRRAAGAPGGLPFGRDNLADFHNLLEAAQVVLDLPFRAFAEELGHSSADPAGRRAVPHFQPDYCAAPARGAFEPHSPDAFHVRAFERAPCDQFVRAVFGNFGVPFNRPPGGRFRHPIRTSVSRRTDRFEVTHKTRQILEVSPDAVESFGRTVDRHGLRHTNGAGAPRAVEPAEPLRADRAQSRHSGHRSGRHREFVPVRPPRSEGRA